jgi:hypothetical protein
MMKLAREFWRDDEGSGQALSEFAIAFPLQLFITFGLMQMILISIANLCVNYASYRACRAAIVGEDKHLAAAIVLAPLAGKSIDAEDLEKYGMITVPGWGPLRGSDVAQAKTLVEEVTTKEDKDLTVVVEFDYELIFPVVDTLYAAFFRSDEAEETETAFGQLDESAEAQPYLQRMLNYNHVSKDYARGRIRKVGGANHLTIARECTMYRQYGLDNSGDGGMIDFGGK